MRMRMSDIRSVGGMVAVTLQTKRTVLHSTGMLFLLASFVIVITNLTHSHSHPYLHLHSYSPFRDPFPFLST